MATQNADKLKVGFAQAMQMILSYGKKRVIEQIKSIWLIVCYLILFLRLVLQLPVIDAATIAAGLIIVIFGLTLFMEGLMLGLMPLGETIGLRLPQKSGLPVILGFALVLGMGATFAEPAIGVLKTAGSSVLAWRAPLLFLMLNKYTSHLVYAVGIGVGIAIMFGMLRFMYNLSLKPFIYILVGLLTVFTIVGAVDPNFQSIIGLAWDCGGVTTGPVTVPLVLALGIGICRVVGKSGGSSGFGVVTLASLFPILTVMLLGVYLWPGVPRPMEESQFFSKTHQAEAQALFRDKEEMIGYALQHASEKNCSQMFKGGPVEMKMFVTTLTEDTSLRKKVFGEDPEAFYRWAVQKGTLQQRLAIFGSEKAVIDAISRYAGHSAPPSGFGLIRKNGLAAAQAIFPLTLFLILVLWVVLREKLPRADEIMFGITLAFAGMMLFSIGIEIGLTRLGNQVGSKLPALFKTISLTDQNRIVVDFDRSVLQTAVSPEGRKHSFFYILDREKFKAVPYRESDYDDETRSYAYVPHHGPLYEIGFSWIIVLLLFAFLMGYGATLAEPALNALGHTVEEMTVGTFKKSHLMQAVAIGVGIGIAIGVSKIVWGIPLAWLLVPPYLLLLPMTRMSSEEFVNIGWDSAGVTTGPVTVPLVLAMGLGIGSQVGVVEGFGILAMASVCPILSVLTMGLVVTRRQRVALQKTVDDSKGARS